jgi:oligopeptide/dipeptide ABC transporter ATP-binding protein
VTASEPLLDVRSLRVVLRDPRGDVSLVDDVSFAVGRGRRFALVGESGSGKTLTALSLLRLIDAPCSASADRLAFEGRDLQSLSQSELRHLRGSRIGFVMQDPFVSLSPVFTVGQQIVETIRTHEPVRRAAAKERAVELLASVGIDDPRRRASAYPHTLSGGMRQRVAIAIALACSPSLIIADEPTTALDVTIQAQVMELLMRLSVDHGTAVLLISHDLGVVAEFAEQIAVMYAGRIVETGTTGAVYGSPRHPYTRALLASQPRRTPGASGRRQRLRPIRGAPPIPGEHLDGCPFHPRCDTWRSRNRCAAELPPLRTIAAGHESACHFAEELSG